ncbi:tetratricopeptide repeat protein [Rhodoferax sp. AJA081-3]|uniref:tetratricopeptide repeat protein n=1 Tax=Rhodoferax sp. AJA081-3 TaxID=2752316 RepID=UPI001ADFA596|nr:tetratricopeptide repeat protein [Rhodoferax sp. AJA081-3]QTN26106.1 tetratricopeptide repeat protein [Rhodoferax sp. AJA081-3]
MDFEEQKKLEAEASQLESLFNNGRYAELEVLARAFVGSYPRLGFGWSVLGAALQVQGKDALPAARKAAELLPEDAMARSNLGDALQALGQYEEAAENYLFALQIDPRSAETHVNLGNALKAQGEVGNAETHYREALRLKPEFTEGHYNLGVVCLDCGRFGDAETSLRRAIELNPYFAIAHVALGTTLKALGRHNEAELTLRQAVHLVPTLAEAHVNLGATLRTLNRSSEAAACFRKALDIDPGLAVAHSNLGAALRESSLASEAEECFRQALRLNPELVDAHSGLAAALKDLDRPDEAVTHCRAALRLNPHSAEALNNLGVLLSELGQFEEAESCYRQAIKIDPGFAEAYSNRLFHLCHMEAVDARALFAEHRKFAEQFETPLMPYWPRHSNLRDPDRTLRVGFVSADLRNHPVASFIDPVLACLAVNPKLSLYAYSNHSYEDAVTQRFKRFLPNWRSCVNLSDDATAQKIIEDRIDVLFDLSGHSARHRLLTFARKPAPIQVSWMGYPGTTGLLAMDYYFADGVLVPPGDMDSQFSEKIVRIPANAPFLPFSDAPPVNDLPALKNGYLTFGSFNLVRKLNPSVIALWSQILHATPNARMLIGGMHAASDIPLVAKWFADVGIVKDRLSFKPKCKMQDYLRLYHQVDICLDTFPYPGCTTSCHALWMGVPTITMAGETPVSRSGASLQSHAGLSKFITNNKVDFIEQAQYWSTRLTELAGIRAGLRDRFNQSALGHSGSVPMAVDQALRIMWHRWCEGLPAEAFDV